MARSITDALRDLRNGVFVDEASDALAALVTKVAETGKPGKLTIELTLKRASRGAGALIIADRLTIKAPAEESAETMMFATPEGSLVANDPRQSTLNLKVATPPPAADTALKVATEG